MKKTNKIEAYQLDLSDTDKIENFVKQGSEKLNGLNILILNTAVTGIRESEDYTLKVDYEAPKRLVESAADLLRTSHGRIVFLTSS